MQLQSEVEHSFSSRFSPMRRAGKQTHNFSVTAPKQEEERLAIVGGSWQRSGKEPVLSGR